MYQFDVPEDHGLMIQLHSDGSVTIETVLDKHYPHIHPNCYAPAELENVRLLHGGGSGTAVFGGDHPALQGLVMKHGSSKDTKEVMSLATIAAELIQRRTLSQTAANDMTRRIPEFVMVYISPYHLRDRGKELWAKLGHVKNTSSGRVSMSDGSNGYHCNNKLPADDNGHNQDRRNSTMSGEILSRVDIYKLSKLTVIHENENPSRRNIRVSLAMNRQVTWCVSESSVNITLPSLEEGGEGGSGIKFLQDFRNELMDQQQLQNWKVTLAQKWIGGTDAVNGADVLTRGKLQGDLLDTLIREFTAVMQDLDQLTLPNERQGHFHVVQKEVEKLRETKNVRDVSDIADSFVGRAICKNFHPDHGRFKKLRMLGEDFRKGDMFFTEAEKVPARFLGFFLQYGTCMEEVFDDAPSPRTALDEMEDRGWLDILEHATQFCESTFKATTECLWTCGLTDAGLHNTFLSVERGLEVFDLGEPGLQPRPAFLTKFLMSFFHTLGMESDGEASWKPRFCLVTQSEGGGERLSLTPETAEKIPYLYQVFTSTVSYFIETIFNGDERVRELLMKYVVLQLLSDASFCLQRWEAKGGGRKRYGDRVNYAMEKWLWRSLWDQYMSAYVHAKLLMRPSAS